MNEKLKFEEWCLVETNEYIIPGKLTERMISGNKYMKLEVPHGYYIPLEELEKMDRYKEYEDLPKIRDAENYADKLAKNFQIANNSFTFYLKPEEIIMIVALRPAYVLFAAACYRNPLRKGNQYNSCEDMLRGIWQYMEEEPVYIRILMELEIKGFFIQGGGLDGVRV